MATERFLYKLYSIIDMIEYETRLKAWGNSVGIVVPKDKIEKEHLRKNQTVRVIISPANAVRVQDIFGKLKNWKKPTGQIMKEVDKELDSKLFGTLKPRQTGQEFKDMAREGWK